MVHVIIYYICGNKTNVPLAELLGSTTNDREMFRSLSFSIMTQISFVSPSVKSMDSGRVRLAPDYV